MILTAEKYMGVRDFKYPHGKQSQTFSVTVDPNTLDGDKCVVSLELEPMQWVDVDTYADYLRWCADEMVKIPRKRNDQ